MHFLSLPPSALLRKALAWQAWWVSPTASHFSPLQLYFTQKNGLEGLKKLKKMAGMKAGLREVRCRN